MSSFFKIDYIMTDKQMLNLLNKNKILNVLDIRNI